MKLILKKYQSTGFKNNYLATSKNIYGFENNPLKNILFDTQTNGPLLMSINPKFKDEFERHYKKLNLKEPLLIGKFIKKQEVQIKII